MRDAPTMPALPFNLCVRAVIWLRVTSSSN
jgi:hypothetical protein